MTRRFTGRHMAGILILFFAVIIAVNLTMARLAGATFGGAVVENSYVASQHFNRWLDEAAKEQALGWQAKAARGPGNRVAIGLTAPEAANARITAVARHPLGRLPDRQLTFTAHPDGRFVSREALPPGRWRLRLTVTATGETWRTEQELF